VCRVEQRAPSWLVTMGHDISSIKASRAGGVGRNRRDSRNHRRHRQTELLDVNRVSGAGSGRDRKLVVGNTRGGSIGTHRHDAVAIMIDEQAIAGQESEEARWRQWKVKGRADEARFRRKLTTVVVAVTGVAAVGGALWFSFGI
jgi:hypothetical protein